MFELLAALYIAVAVVMLMATGNPVVAALWPIALLGAAFNEGNEK